MNVALKPLTEQVIVITGASSGIGLATAFAAAQAGVALVAEVSAAGGSTIRPLGGWRAGEPGAE